MGAHRCGSTAIQSLLRREQDQLLDRGVRVYLRADMVSGDMDLRRLHRYMLVNPSWQRKLKQIAQSLCAMDHDVLLASEENLMGTMPAVRGHGFYPHFDRLIRALARLDVLVGGTVAIAPRLVVRRQDHYLESVYAFRVSRGFEKSFDSFVRTVTRSPISWLRLGQTMSRLPATMDPAIALLEAWPKPAAADKALDFLIGPSDVELSVHRLTGNTRYSSSGLRFILALNRAKVAWQNADWKRDVFDLVDIYRDDPEADLAYAIKHRVGAREFARFESHYSPEAKLGFTSDERAAFLAQYADENREFLNLPVVTGTADSWALPG